jgi:hypothetical protein
MRAFFPLHSYLEVMIAPANHAPVVLTVQTQCECIPIDDSR